MAFTIQLNTAVIVVGPPTSVVSVTDANGYVTQYGYTVLADGTPRLTGSVNFREDSVRRQAAQSFLTYNFVSSSSIQIQRLANGVIEIYDPAEPTHVSGNPTRYNVINGQVSSTSYIVGSGPNSYVATANAFLAARNFS